MGLEISVIVPTYRRPEKLVRLVDALSRQTLPPDRWEVVVVDDCSGADHEATFAALPSLIEAPLHVVRTPANGGPDKARTVGLHTAKTDLLAFCDDDVIPDPGWLEAGLAALRADSRLGVVQGRTRLPDGITEEDISRFVFRIAIDGPGPFFETCNIFYRREALDDAGGITEDIGISPLGRLTRLDGWVPGNDSATGWAVVEAGWERGFAADAGVVHEVIDRGWAWLLRYGWQEHAAVALAARHPGFRREAFWRPWAHRRSSAAFALAAASSLVALRWRPAIIGVVPYLWYGRPSRHDPQFWKACAQTLAIDAARFAGHVAGSVRSGVVVV